MGMPSFRTSHYKKSASSLYPALLKIHFLMRLWPQHISNLTDAHGRVTSQCQHYSVCPMLMSNARFQAYIWKVKFDALKLPFWFEASLQSRLGLKAVHTEFCKCQVWQCVLTKYALETWLVIVLIRHLPGNQFLRHTNAILPYWLSLPWTELNNSISQNILYSALGSQHVHIV